jgi:GNAT superfamily N-acetyltransferase
VSLVARDVLHMRKTWSAPEPTTAAAPIPIRIRELDQADETALGRLMWLAFRGTIDDEYGSAAEADADAVGLLAGRWGPVIWPASLVAESESAIVSTAAVVRDSAHQGLPLLAFALTEPGWQRRGLGQRLIEESIQRLDAVGVKELHLAVTRGNPAIRLYQRLGFQVVTGEGTEPLP